jgi:calcineurin-like phosphoesterase family protein
MNAELIRRWNSVVGPDDTVYCLGDFCWGNVGDYASKLNGRKVLVLGNHDKESQCRGHFDEIVTYKQLVIDGKKVHLKHYPFKSDCGPYDTKFLDRMLEDDGEWLLHGHTHNTTPQINKKSINMSCEHWDYTPVSETQIIEIMKNYAS